MTQRQQRLEVEERVATRLDDAVVLSFAGTLGAKTFETFRAALTRRRPPQQRVRIVEMSQVTEVAPEEVPRAATLLRLLRDESQRRLLVAAPPEGLAERLLAAQSRATEEREPWVFPDAEAAQLALATEPSHPPAPVATDRPEPATTDHAAHRNAAALVASQAAPTHHLDAFLGFCYGLLKNQSIALPPGASAEGLAAVFADDGARARVSEVLSSLALERLIRALPLLAPEVIAGEKRFAASPWDERLDAHLRPGIHPRTLHLLAHLFLVGSRACSGVAFDESKDGGRYMIELGDRLIAEGRVCRGSASQSPLPGFAHFVEFEDSEASEFAALDPFAYSGHTERLSLVDLLLLDDTVHAAQQASIKLARQVPELAAAWRKMLAPMLLLSPLSAVTRMVERLTVTKEETPFAEALARPATEATLEHLFGSGNALVFTYLESEILGTWCLEEERSRHRAALRDAWLEVFTATLERLFTVAERTGHVSVLKVVPHFYAEWFQRTNEQQFTRHVRARMVELKRLAERQERVRRELGLFEPLQRFLELLQRLRELNWAECTAEQAFLLDQPLPMLPRLRQSVRLCREKLALPFGHIART